MEVPFRDVCSLSNIKYFKTNHIDWYIDADFPTKTLRCCVSLEFECILPGNTGVLLLDTRDLTIKNVKVDDVDVDHKLLAKDEALGQALEICLPSHACTSAAKFHVSVTYSTSPRASAAQWLPPVQTLGKKFPYMYTQCQRIHARSLLPCQDSPGCKFSYSAEITVPEDMVALMSAIKGEENTVENGRKVCCFKQDIPIPAYLLAIAIGAIESRSVGPRSRVWCEAEMIDACEYEFAHVEEMLQIAESLMGPYVWGVYDMLVLPPSFPCGGMENACLTFLTPTIITGDRSLTTVMIHEITHSWTGNLVTNKKWEDFWLNEGFTRFIEGKMNGLRDGEVSRQFMLVNGWHRLIGCVNDLGATNKLTALVPDLSGINPGDASSPVPYEKGAAFLYYIESLVGGADVFNPFLKDYINHFKSTAIETEDFKEYLLGYFDDKKEILQKIDWNSWLYLPGMPPVNVLELYDSSSFNCCNLLCDKWVKSSPHHIDSFNEEEFSSLTTRQKISFLSKLYLEKPLSIDHVTKMAQVYKLFSYNVCDIKFAFLRLCVRAKWTYSYEHVVQFLLEQGRAKFIRPLYKEMFRHAESKELAVETFRKSKHMYHSISANKIAKDLQLVE